MTVQRSWSHLMLFLISMSANHQSKCKSNGKVWNNLKTETNHKVFFRCIFLSCRAHLDLSPLDLSQTLTFAGTAFDQATSYDNDDHAQIPDLGQTLTLTFIFPCTLVLTSSIDVVFILSIWMLDFFLQTRKHCQATSCANSVIILQSCRISEAPGHQLPQ